MIVKVKETRKPVKRKKEFHAVEMMREIRNKIDKDIEGMNYEELRAYIDAKLGKEKKLKRVRLSQSLTMKTEISKAQLEVWKWKERAWESLKNIPEDKKIAAIKERVKEEKARILLRRKQKMQKAA